MAYRLQKSESLQGGVRRIVSEEIHSATDQLAKKAGGQRDDAVHEARKSIKKIRGVLRLLRPELGHFYERENIRFRNVGRELSDLRDAAALLEMFDQLSVKFKDVLDATGLKSIRHGLQQEKREVEQRIDIPGIVRSATVTLDAASKRLMKWPFAKDGFGGLAPGLKQTYKRGRRALRHAEKRETPGAFHELRKRVKDHWYHVRLLEGAWTDAMQAHERSLKELETWLGDDHNLVVLRDKLKGHPEKYGGEGVVLEFMSFLARHQSELQRDSLALGERIYGEKPRAIVHNFATLWEAWHRQPDNVKSLSKSDVAAVPKPAGKVSGRKSRSRTA